VTLTALQKIFQWSSK